MAGQPTAVRRRGRPLSHISEGEDSALKARRERNREAQNVFRKRRQAAEAEQTKRLRRLEEIVEEMGSVFMSFVDEVLQVESVKQDGGLMHSLRRSTERVVALAHEVVGPEEDCLGGVETKCEVPKTPAIAIRTAWPQADSSSSLGSSPSQMTESESVSGTNQVHTPKSTGFDFDTFVNPKAAADVQTPVILPDSPPSLPPQVFGNGWQDEPGPRELPGHPEDWTHRSPLAPESFACRLVKHSLTTGYLILSGSKDSPVPLTEEHRIFASTLKHRSREEMLTRMRWLLGPGQRDMFKVADMPWGQWGDRIIHRDGLHPGPAGTRGDEAVIGSPKYLSVFGVEKQLVALGAKIVDPDTLELNITGPPAAERNEAIVPQPDSWSFVDFYSAEQLRPKPSVLRMRLSVSLLVEYLSSNAICLLRGPGYAEADIGKAIEASIIATAGDDWSCCYNQVTTYPSCVGGLT